MNLETKYKKSLDKQWSLRFKTRHPCGKNYDGVVTNIQNDFIVLQEESQFEFDGTIILAKKYISGCRDGKFERCSNEILRDTGALKKCRSPRWLRACQTFLGVLAELMEREIWPGIEVVFRRKPKSALYLGPIIGIAEDRFRIRCYDAGGKWEKNYWLRYDRIFKIEIDSKYCKRFNAYMLKHEDKQFPTKKLYYYPDKYYQSGS